jgi:hypothetical protein
LEGVDAVTVMMQHEIEAKAARRVRASGPHSTRCSPGVMEYHPISDREES